MSEANTEVQPGDSFVEVARQIDRGRKLTDLDRGIRDLVEAVKETGKKGKLTYTLEILPVPKTGGEQVVLVDDVVVKPPKPEPKVALFFTTDEGRLSRNDPRQMEFQAEVIEYKKEEKLKG